MYTSAKARLTGVAIRIRIRIWILDTKSGQSEWHSWLCSVSSSMTGWRRVTTSLSCWRPARGCCTWRERTVCRCSLSTRRPQCHRGSQADIGLDAMPAWFGYRWKLSVQVPASRGGSLWQHGFLVCALVPIRRSHTLLEDHEDDEKLTWCYRRVIITCVNYPVRAVSRPASLVYVPAAAVTFSLFMAAHIVMDRPLYFAAVVSFFFFPRLFSTVGD